MENVPDVDKKDSWLVYKLTKGKSYKTDYSNASRTQLLNLLKHNSVFGETDFEGYLGYLGIPMVRCLDTTAEKKVR